MRLPSDPGPSITAADAGAGEPAPGDRPVPLRRLPAPQSEPPYEEESAQPPRPDERGGGPVQGTLALAFVLPTGLPARPAAPRLRLLPPPGSRPTGEPTGDPAGAGEAHAGHRPPGPAPDGRPGDRPGAGPGYAADDEEEPGDRRPRPTPTAALPEPRDWAGRFLQAVVEVLAGDRPVAQLVRWTAADVFADLQRRVTVAARRCPPGLAGQPRSVVRSVHVSAPADGVVEVCALVQRGPRARAVALRLVGLDGRWQCTALELG